MSDADNTELKPCFISGCSQKPQLRLTQNGDSVRCRYHTRWMPKWLWNTRAPAQQEGWRKIEERDKQGPYKILNMGNCARLAMWCESLQLWTAYGAPGRWNMKNQPTLIYDIPQPPQEESKP